jgi:hypothetical protein
VDFVSNALGERVGWPLVRLLSACLRQRPRERPDSAGRVAAEADLLLQGRDRWLPQVFRQWMRAGSSATRRALTGALFVPALVVLGQWLVMGQRARVTGIDLLVAFVLGPIVYTVLLLPFVALLRGHQRNCGLLVARRVPTARAAFVAPFVAMTGFGLWGLGVSARLTERLVEGEPSVPIEAVWAVALLPGAVWGIVAAGRLGVRGAGRRIALAAFMSLTTWPYVEMVLVLPWTWLGLGEAELRSGGGQVLVSQALQSLISLPFVYPMWRLLLLGFGLFGRSIDEYYEAPWVRVQEGA